MQDKYLFVSIAHGTRNSLQLFTIVPNLRSFSHEYHDRQTNILHRMHNMLRECSLPNLLVVRPVYHDDCILGLSVGLHTRRTIFQSAPLARPVNDEQ